MIQDARASGRQRGAHQRRDEPNPFDGSWSGEVEARHGRHNDDHVHPGLGQIPELLQPYARARGPFQSDCCRESEVWSIRRPRRLPGTARLQECDELRKFVARDAARECRHVVPAVVDPEDQLIFGQSVADPTKIGTAVPAVAGDVVAVNAPLVEEDSSPRAAGTREGRDLFRQRTGGELR